MKAGTAPEAFAHYLRVRDLLRGMQESEPQEALTASERQMLLALEALWDAPPKEIATLRAWSKPITGVLKSHYKGPAADGTRIRLERDLGRLLEKGDPALLVDEPHALGGFGFEAQGKRYNEDTLRFFRVMSLLQEAALLKEFGDPGRRRTVWDIGGGWGGFAYQLKTLCPNVTYLITGHPSLFLISAVYLTVLFPSATVRFYDRAQPDLFWDGWDAVDFAFAPESAVAGMRPPSVDLTIDLMTLERMTPSRIAAHVQHAYDLNCRYFFSVCPSDTLESDVVSPVQPAVDRLYWPHPVSAPLYLAKRLALGVTRRGGPDAITRTYLLGWRRLRV
jgi:hypothetical protein